MRVAVTIPVWNQRPSLLNAAVMSSYHSDGQVFVVDDGSDVPVVNGWGDWVTLIRIPHGGVPAAFNAAMDAICADGGFDYVCRFASDDTMDSDKIDRQLAFMEGVGCDASFHDCRDSRDGKPYPTGLDRGTPNDRARWRKVLRRGNRFYGGTSMIRADVLRDYRHPLDLIYCQDWNLHCWIEANSRGWEYLPRFLSTIGRYGGGLETKSYTDPAADVCRRAVAKEWSAVL